MSMGVDRLLTQNSIPLVPTTLPDGSTGQAIAMLGTFEILTQRPFSSFAIPVLTTVAHANGDAVGGVLVFEGVTTSETVLGITVDSVVIIDKAGVEPDLDLVLFRNAVSAPTDADPFDPSALDIEYYLGHVPIRATDWTSFVANGGATVRDVGLNTVLTGQDLYGVLVARETYTPTGTDDLTVYVNVRRD